MRVTIDSEHLEKITAWITSGRGVRRWENLEIGGGHAREVFTPADHDIAPNWRYGNPIDLQPDDIHIRYSKVLETFRGRFKAMYWGPWVGAATESKARRLAKAHGQPEDSWTWEHMGAGLVMVSILRSEVKPLTAHVRPNLPVLL